MKLPEKAQTTLVCLIAILIASGTAGGVFYCIGIRKGEALAHQEAIEHAREHLRQQAEEHKADIEEAWGQGYRAAQIDAHVGSLPEGE